MFSSVLQSVPACCNRFRCAAVHCNGIQHTQYIQVCCSALQWHSAHTIHTGVLQCIAKAFSTHNTYRCVAVHCNSIQHTQLTHTMHQHIHYTPANTKTGSFRKTSSPADTISQMSAPSVINYVDLHREFSMCSNTL